MKSLRFNINTGFLFLFKIFILTYTFIDLIRRFFDGSKVLLMSLDIIIVTTLFYFVATNKSKIRYIHNISIYLRVILFLLFMIILLQVFNPYYYDMKTYIVGFRSYLLAVPIILIGYYFSKNKLLLTNNMIYFIIILFLITLVYAIFQLTVDYSLLVGTPMDFIAPMEHGAHSHYDKEIQLTSSFFASSKRYGHFLMIMYLLYIGISLTINKQINIFIIALFVIVLIVSGARESLVLFLFINIVLMIKFMKLKLWIVVFIFIIVSIGLFIMYASDALLFKIDFMLSSPDEYLRRIYMFFPFAFSNFSNPDMFFGLGVGKYGQETLLNTDLFNVTYRADRIFFHDLDFFSSAYGFMDAGLAKITIELGFLGISIYLLFIIYILYLAIRNIIYLSEDKLKLGFSLFIVLWVIYIMKAHPNLSDIFMSYFLFFSIGYISYKEKKKVEICN